MHLIIQIIAIFSSMLQIPIIYMQYAKQDFFLILPTSTIVQHTIFVEKNARK